MRTFTIVSFSLFIATVLAGHHYTGPIPKDRHGKLTTHQDPRINAKYTGATLNPLFTPDLSKVVEPILGKRRLVDQEEYSATAEELELLKREFDHHEAIPGMYLTICAV